MLLEEEAGVQDTGKPPVAQLASPGLDDVRGPPALTRGQLSSMEFKMKTTPSHTRSKGDQGPLNQGCVCTKIIFIYNEDSFDTFPVSPGAPTLPVP